MSLKISGKMEKLSELNEDILQLVIKGEKLHLQGRYKKAEEIYREILARDPKNSIAYHHLGIMALQGKQIDLAKTLLKAASDLEPENVRYLIDLGTVYFNMQKHIEATKVLKKALELDPDNYEALFNLGTVYLERGMHEEAVNYLDRAVVLNPLDPRPFVKLAYCLVQLGRFEEAEEIAKAAYVLKPKTKEDQFILMDTFLELNSPWYAIPLGKMLVEKDPANISFRTRLSNAYSMAGVVCKAEEEARHALNLAPNTPGLYKLLAQAMMVCTGWDEALEVVEEGLKLDPENEGLLLQKASIYEKKGWDEDAFYIVKQFFTGQRQHNPQAVSLLGVLCKKFKAEKEGIDVLNEAIENTHLGQGFICSVKFTLAELYEAIGKYDKAFKELKEANDLVPRIYHGKREEEYFERLKKVFTKEFFQKAKRSTIKTKKPIFIVGMPRSGTSLTEQILATHPDVYGAGELAKIGEIASTLSHWMGKNIPFPEIALELDEKTLNKAAQEYLDFIDSLSGGVFLHVTDKMPQNFLYMGLMALIFPEVKIIHCRRNPYDTCLSNYFQNFAAAGLSFAYNLEDLGHYYRLYLDIMQHWREVLPITFYESQYEELVKKPREKIKELLDFCELDWYEGCLEFYKTKRDVKTASYDQVRKPLYTKSVSRWKRYEKHLEPLKKVLEADEGPGLSLKQAGIIIDYDSGKPK